MLSNVVDTQVATHALYGGVVPEIASRAPHGGDRPRDRAGARGGGDGISTEVDAVAATCAPGLIGALLVGVNFAQVARVRDEQAARPGASHPRPYRRELSGVSRARAAVPGARRLGRPQRARAWCKDYTDVRDPRRHARRRRGRGVRQGRRACWGVRLSRRRRRWTALAQVRRPEALQAARQPACQGCAARFFVLRAQDGGHQPSAQLPSRRARRSTAQGIAAAFCTAVVAYAGAADARAWR